MSWLKQLFCKHKYTQVANIPCTFTSNGVKIKVPIFCYECSKCGHRYVIKEADCFYCYSVNCKIKLWLKHQIDM